MASSPYSSFYGPAPTSGVQPTESSPSLGSDAASSSPVPTASSTPYSSFYGAAGGQTSSPDNGQQDSGTTQHVYQDSSQPWYKRAWDFANTPVTESLFGLPEERQGAGGFERAVEHIASGLTSPLSIALTAATFGTGGFIESAGASALKEAGFTAAEIADAAKGSEAAVQAARDLRPVEPVINDALKAGGHDLKLLDRAREAVAPLNRDAELASDELQSNLSKVGLNNEQRIALDEGKLSGSPLPKDATGEEIQAHRIAEEEARSGIASANKGFSTDELKDLAKTGDTVAKAKGEFNPIEDAVRGSGADVDTWKRADAELAKQGMSAHDLIGDNTHALERGAFQILRHTLPDVPIAVSVRMAKTANAVLNAGFTLQQFETAAAMSPRFLDALKEGDSDKAWEYGTEWFAGSALGIAGASHALHSAGELFQPLLESAKWRPNDEFLAMDRANKEREVQHAIAVQQQINLDTGARKILGHEPPRPILGDTKEVADRKQLELASVYHQVVTGGDQAKAAQWHDALQEAVGSDKRISPENGQPDLRDQIDTNNFKKLPKDYQDRVIESLRRVAQGELSPKELEAAKLLRDEQSKNFQIGSANDILHAYVEDYMRRAYEDENPQGRVVLSDAKQGKFATNVSAARQRVYDSHITALLKSPKKMSLDPISLTAEGRGQLIKAAANKQLIDTLRDKFSRGSDGRPAVVLSGQGQVVSGPNGEDPKTFFDPSRIRKINVAQSVIDQLTKSGDLQRYLDEGTLKDITPYVRPNNIQAALEKLEEQSQRKEAQYDEVGNNKLSTQIMYLKSMIANKDFSGLKDFNDGLTKNYAWDPQDYISLEHNAMKGWNFITNDSAGHNVLVRTDIRVHPEFAEYLKNRLGLAESGVANNPIGKALLGVGTKAKETLLSLSPFHMIQEGLRAILVGVNPFHITGPDIINGERIDPADPHSDTILKKVVEQGGTLGVDYKAQQSSSEGVSSGGDILRKIPGVGKTMANSMDWYQNFLFRRYIPALKARAAELLFHRYQDAHPDWSVDRVARATGTHVNNTFGGIPWQRMGRSATTQDWGRLLLLAPDWLEAEMNSGARLFNKEEGGVGRAQIAKMSLGLWGVARVLNYMTTGNFHNEAPFGLAVKNKEGKETVFSIRTLPTDLLHLASNPSQFLIGRLSPTIRTGQELLSGRDQYGRKLGPEDLWADVFRNMAPIPVQSIGQALTSTGPSVGNPGQVWKSVGGTAQTYATPAQKMAADLASSHSEDGLVDPSQQARHRRIIQFEDQVRAGEMSYPDLMKLTYSTDQLKESELQKIQKNLKATHEMPSDMASLYTRASRLPAKEYLDLLNVANPSEKAALVPLTIQVQRRYLTKAKKEMTPQERAQDHVFQKLLHMVQQPPPQQQ